MKMKGIVIFVLSVTSDDLLDEDYPLDDDDLAFQDGDDSDIDNDFDDDDDDIEEDIDLPGN